MQAELSQYLGLAKAKILKARAQEQISPSSSLLLTLSLRQRGGGTNGKT